jgi:RNA polymerase sigma factor (TIGR02999 family)
MARREEITAWLDAAAAGRPEATAELLPLVYEELAELAHRQRWRFRAELSPGTKSLVHEAYLKLAGRTAPWGNRAVFFAVAARAMRSILVDNARHFARAKREGRLERVPLDEGHLVSEQRGPDLLALDAALDRLAGSEERLARIVECRFFAGLTVEESAEALDLSPATVKRGWILARAWLARELGAGALPPAS